MSPLLLLFLLFLSVNADSKLFNVRQLSAGGDHTLPKFSPDGKAVYFTAKGGPYESSCTHVYRFDLRTPAQPVSLVSTGIGEEFGVAIGDQKTFELSLPTASQFLLKNSASNAPFTTDGFCQPSVCSNTNLDAKTKAACRLPHKERHEYAWTTSFDWDGVPFGIIVPDGHWTNVPLRLPGGRLLRTRLGKRGVGKTQVIGWADGFDSLPSDVHQSILFHGEGVLPLAGTSIYRTTFDDVSSGGFSLTNPVLSDDNFYFLNPKFVPDSSGRFFYTKVEKNSGKPAVYLRDGNSDVLIRDRARDMNVIALNGTIFVTFAAQIGTSGDFELFLGTFGEDSEYPVIAADIWPTAKPPSPYISNSVQLYKSDFYEAFGLSVSADGNWLMFAARSPLQIYQVDLRADAAGFVRRISPGYRFFSSAVFLSAAGGEGDVLAISSITDSSTCVEHETESRCVYSSTGRALSPSGPCSDSVVVDLPANNEIYRLNSLGTIKQRLTNNANYEGELAVSPDFKRVVFSSNRDGDYDLYIADLDDIDHPQRLTNTTGFEGGVRFTPDGQSLVFFASRPQSADDRRCYEQLRAQNMAALSAVQLFSFDLTTKVERQLTNFTEKSSNLIRFALDQNGDFLYVMRDYNFQRIDLKTKEIFTLPAFQGSNYFKGIAFGTNGDVFVTNSYYQVVRGIFNPNAGTTPAMESTTKGADGCVRVSFVVFFLLLWRVLLQ
ncbi:hypothetical protein M3Y99_01633100 [Aphelenchoides fujianensis]|nr:hypothetical protein M3Y99_01633100 [Aphelenchoides fujianensis]